ncbi:MAG: hypothetical protein J7621_19135 [Niastella sp.]|nr:hypothetical protein [Niastella sp.]
MAHTITVITNNETNHRFWLRKLFAEADEVKIAVAFLKYSGYANLKDVLEIFYKSRAKKSTFFVGLGIGATDPKALRRICTLIQGRSNHELILCTPDAGIFHSKLYMFVTGRIAKIVIGSANMTEGGWVINDEISVLIETSINSPEYSQFDSYLKKLYTEYRTENIGGLIDEYELQLNNYVKDHPSVMAFKFRRRLPSTGVDLNLLKAYLQNYPYSRDYIDPEDRQKRYEQAKENLDIIASSVSLTSDQFEDLFGPLVGHAGYDKLWHSGSIHRKSYSVLNYIPVFRELVRLIKENIGMAPSVVFDRAKSFTKEKIQRKQLAGIGVNIITEILMTYNPRKFPNLNKNPLAVLTLIGEKYSSATNFRGEDYESYAALLLKIASTLHMNSLLEIDSFFNYIYWRLMEEGQ